MENGTWRWADTRIDAEDKKAQIRAALWSLYSAGHGLTPAMVPEELRPISLEDGLQILLGDEDEHAPVRQVRAANQLYAAAVLPIPDVWRPPTAPLRDPRIDADGEYVEVYTEARRISSALNIDRELVEQLLRRLRTSGCANPFCSSTYLGTTLTTTATSTVIVEKDINSLTQLLDPRGWMKCSDVFAETCRVRDDGTPYYPRLIEETPAGAPWYGLLYEYVNIGPMSFENILEVTFATQTNRVEIQFRLYHGLSYAMGIVSAPGGLRNDYGSMVATANGANTAITCEKTVNFKSLTPSCLGGAVNYGELMNYFAPAAMCLWLDDITSIIPCCSLVGTQTPHG